MPTQRIPVPIFAFAVFIGFAITTFASSPIDGLSHQTVNVDGGDIEYDPFRDLLYITVDSSAGFPSGNSVVSVNPSTGNIVDSVFVGSEPRKLELSDDGSRLYIGIDGALAFRWLNLSSRTLSPLVNLYELFNRPSLVQDFAVRPGDASTVAVALDDPSNSGSGFLNVYLDGNLVIAGATLSAADQIDFASQNTLISFEDSSTGYRLIRWDYDAGSQTLDQDQTVNGLIRGFTTNIEVSGSTILASNGSRASINPLAALGTYSVADTRAAVEDFPAANLTYFLSTSSFGSSDPLLQVFASNTFLQIDSQNLGVTVNGAMEKLISAGGDRLAYLTEQGQIGIISGITVSGPGDINGDGCVDIGDFFILQTNFDQPGGRADGDLTGDGNVTIGDFLILQANFGNCAGPSDEPQVAALLEAQVSNLDPEADKDGDGISDSRERDARTDPYDRGDFFAITGAVYIDNKLELRWKSVAGEAYVIEYSTTGEPDSWEELDAEPLVARGSAMVDRFEAIAPQEKNVVLYRVRCVRH